MSFGSGEEGGFNDVSRAYKQNPTLENYLALRRADPDAEIEVAVLGGIDDLFAVEKELERYGIGAHPLMTGVLDANQAAVSELSLKLMDHIVRARELTENGETQLVRRGMVMPDSLIDWLICVALDAQSWTDSMELNRDLIVLIRERLGGANQHYKQAVAAHTRQRNAPWIGAQLKARGIEPTVRKIAELLEVAPSTVTRWYPNNAELQEEIDRLSRLFDSNGSFHISRLSTKKEP
ncbi:hypothetical protein [Terricaulis silvestris]|uniref:Uncharacterized protein n=1 Tax=Terricaulis silvestris TaxID=2686094 RepID=A0A6I6MNN2_9CAUL|nr:hypothetical protein [Terricaulis silvestris]QGZ94968.1 hypothetical protein DSM104635_01803 [Terricaulis silvestris]